VGAEDWVESGLRGEEVLGSGGTEEEGAGGCSHQHINILIIKKYSLILYNNNFIVDTQVRSDVL
jgi:hypothetical protein